MLLSGDTDAARVDPPAVDAAVTSMPGHAVERNEQCRIAAAAIR
jgi:hypothetical protein